VSVAPPAKVWVWGVRVCVCVCVCVRVCVCERERERNIWLNNRMVNVQISSSKTQKKSNRSGAHSHTHAHTHTHTHTRTHTHAHTHRGHFEWGKARRWACLSGAVTSFCLLEKWATCCRLIYNSKSNLRMAVCVGDSNNLITACLTSNTVWSCQ